MRNSEQLSSALDTYERGACVNIESLQNPLFVVIVGIDGSGKTSLVNRLKQQGFEPRTWRDLQQIPEAAHLAPPRPTLVRSILSPLPRAIFVGGHFVAEYEYLIRPRLENGQSVLFDSYYFKGLGKETIYKVVHPVFFEICRALPKPDVVFYLDVDPVIAFCRKKRLSPYEYLVSPTEDDFVAFQRQLARLLKATTNGIYTKVIDANQPLDEVELSVVSQLGQLGLVPYNNVESALLECEVPT